jgi:tetratricopeptide (TPR) repeat protein
MRSASLAWGLVIGGLLCVTATRAAAEPALAEGQDSYLRGKEAFERADYGRAYELFRRSYALSKRSELLFNMASALQHLERPDDAAEALRAYLRVRPDDPERPQIEERIRALGEEGRLLGEERQRRARAHRKRVVTALAVSGAVLVAAGVGLALGLTLGAPPPAYTPTPLGAHPATP